MTLMNCLKGQFLPDQAVVTFSLSNELRFSNEMVLSTNDQTMCEIEATLKGCGFSA